MATGFKLGARGGACRRVSVWRVCLVAVACLLLWGCQDFETRIAYRGARRLTPLPLEVRSVFWPPSGPLVFAVERQTERNIMHLVPISGEAPCRAGPVDRFVAVVREDALQLGLLDRAGARVAFHSADCDAWEVPVEGATSLRLRSRRRSSRFLVESEDAGLWLVEPSDQSVLQLARDVRAVGAEMFEAGAEDAFWVQTADRLTLVDTAGQERAPGIDAVDRFTTYSGSGSDLEPHAYALVQRGRELTLFDASDWALRQGTEPPERVWSVQDACGTRIDLVAGSCSGQACRSDDPDVRGRDGLRQVPWASFYSPCDSETLVLRSDAKGEPLTVAEDVEAYRVLGQAEEGLPVVVVRAASDRSQDYLVVAGEPPEGLGLRVRLGSVQMLGPGPSLAFRTEDGTGRLMLYRRGAAVREVLSGVVSAAIDGLALHDFEEGVGQLSLCRVPACIPIAQGVLPGQFAAYDTVERVGDPIRLMTFIHEADAARGVGRLSVLNRQDGSLTTVADEVSAFSQVEFGGARGIVYSVPNGDHRGLWYAAR